MDRQFFKVERDAGVTTVTFHRPPVNALSTQALQELEGIADELKQDKETKVVVLASQNPNVFIAGADIKEFPALTSKAQAQAASNRGQAILNKIETIGKPVIAAVNAICLGGGMELVMACHIRIASDRSRFGQPEITLGIVPAFGGTQRLPRIVGLSKATELILTGDTITAQEAFRIGLVNRVVPDRDLMKQAKGLAKQIASKGAVAIEKTMAVIDQSRRLTLEEGLKLEASVFGELCETEDMKEGVTAFLEKRQPQFKNK